MKFDVGLVVVSRGIADRMVKDTYFKYGVEECLKRYANCDWGDSSKEDAEMNDVAIKIGERILAAYELDGERIWIITEYDRSATTILYPSEY